MSDLQRYITLGGQVYRLTPSGRVRHTIPQTVRSSAQRSAVTPGSMQSAGDFQSLVEMVGDEPRTAQQTANLQRALADRARLASTQELLEYYVPRIGTRSEQEGRTAAEAELNMRSQMNPALRRLGPMRNLQEFQDAMRRAYNGRVQQTPDVDQDTATEGMFRAAGDYDTLVNPSNPTTIRELLDYLTDLARGLIEKFQEHQQDVPRYSNHYWIAYNAIRELEDALQDVYRRGLLILSRSSFRRTEKQMRDIANRAYLELMQPQRVQYNRYP